MSRAQALRICSNVANLRCVNTFFNIGAFFLDTVTFASPVTTAVLISLASLMIVLTVVLLRHALQMTFAPWQRIKWRRQWHAVAKKEG